MTKNQMNERNQLEMLTIEQLVPENHGDDRRPFHEISLPIRLMK